VCPTDQRGRSYEVRLSGELSQDEVDAAFDHFELVRREATTVMRGRIADQAALHRVLRLARAYGLEVVEIRLVTRTGSNLQVEHRR
jgi:hypothetical protein